MLRPGLSRMGSSLRTVHRPLHTIPPINHGFDKVGVPEFLSPAAVDIAWTQYQGLMIRRLNDLTSGGDWERMSPKDIAIKYARDPNSAPTFNYASMAHNNDFFFKCLAPQETPMPNVLRKELEASFSSIETLKKEMIVTAASMFGPGFVWLVQGRDAGRKFSILTTYLAGSPYPGAHYRRQGADMNTMADKSLSGNLRIQALEPVNTVGAHGSLSKKAMAPGGIELNPVLCINTWEHVYLPDYGVEHKKLYAENWWKRIDWNVVYGNAALRERGDYMH